uniref:restriction endonuclease subunit S n=1 Tax=Clostridium sp. TaxID=1506 RepID=UPI00262C86F8
KKGLMQQLLTKGIGHTKFKRTEIGEIPEEWKVKTLGEIFRLASGKFLSQKNIVNGIYPVYGGNGITGYHDKFLMEDSKIVIGRVGAKCGCVCISNPNSWITDNALYVSEKIEPFNDNYMYYLLDNVNLNSYANKNAQPVISGEKIYALIIGFPNIEEQEKIASILYAIDNKIESHRNRKDKLEELKRGLMQELLTGRIRAL